MKALPKETLETLRTKWQILADHWDLLLAQLIATNDPATLIATAAEMRACAHASNNIQEIMFNGDPEAYGKLPYFNAPPGTRGN